MKSMNYKRTKLFSLVLVLSFIVGMLAIPTKSYSAAAQKAKLDYTEYYMGGGSLSRDGNFYAPSMKHNINVENPVKKATYSFESSNTKVVTVKASKTKCYLTGVSVGKATVTCYQKLNGKTTKVGTCKVVVGAAKVTRICDTLCIGTSVLMGDYDSVCQINYRNTNAKYTYKTNSKDFTMWEVKEQVTSFSKDAYIYVQKYTAKKPGLYTVTVNETVGKTTKKVGTFKIKVVEPVYEKEIEMYVNDSLSVSDIIENPINNAYDSYTVKSEDESVVAISLVNDYAYFDAKKEGTTKLIITEKASNKQVATVNVAVKIAHIEDLEIDIDDKYYLEDETDSCYVTKKPYKAIEELTVTSSDPKVADIKFNEDDEFEIIMKSAGEVTFTFTCGSIERKATITVVGYDDDDDYDDYDDDDYDW